MTAGQLASALRAGSTKTARMSPVSIALIRSLFAELSPALIMQCAIEADADITNVNQLYYESLADSSPHVKDWEQSVEYFL